jgi:dipeptidyl aminopeptidase/acylaminoacyl peptidase
VSRFLSAILLSATALAVPATVHAQSASDRITVTAPAVPTARFPVSVFGLQPFMRTPRISPDGTKLVVELARSGKGGIGIIDLTKPGSAPTFFIATTEVRDVGDRTVQGYRWIGNNNVVVTLISRENIFGQRGDVTRLVGYNITTKKITPLAWDGAVFGASDILYVDHDKAMLLLARQSNAYGTELNFKDEVVSVDVNTGKFTVVQRPNPIVDQWYADGKGVIRAAAASDGNSDVTGKSRLLYRSTGAEQFRTVVNDSDATFTGTQVRPSVFLDEPDAAIALYRKDDIRRAYKLDMKTMKLGEMLFESPGYDLGNPVLNWDRNKILGYSYTANRSRSVWIDKDWKIIQAVMDEQFGKDNAQVVSRDRKDEKIVFFVAKPSQPGGYYLFDTVSGNLQLLGWYHPVLKDRTMNPMQTIVYTARDGTKIPAVVTMPRHRIGQKNLPVVVMPHGGPFGVRQEEEFGYFPWHQALAEQGYVVIEPNYRGSGGYGRAFEMKGRDPNGYGKTMQDDNNDALTWFAKDGTIDPKRACILGWSYGGYSAARGAQRDPDLWRCAVAGAGVYDMPMMNRWDSENLSNFSSKFQATSNDPAGISPAQNTKGKWAPILVVTAVRDQRIPMEQAQALVSRLKGAGKVEGTDYRYIVQPQGTHNLPYEDVHIQFLDEANKWIQRWNPAYVATDKDREPPLVAAAGGQGGSTTGK